MHIYIYAFYIAVITPCNLDFSSPQELIEKKILKTGPYRPSAGKESIVTIQREKDIRRDWKKDAYMYKAPPYILGYTGVYTFSLYNYVNASVCVYLNN